MRRKMKKYSSNKRSAVSRGLCFLLAGLMAMSNVAPSLGTINAYAVTPEKPVNPDGSIPNGNKPQDTVYTEEVYVNDTPLRLQVSKVKTAQGDHEGLNPKTAETTLADTITYKVSGRIEGSENDLMDKYGADMIELAYSNNGTYLGYGWLKGTLEYLSKRKAQNVDEEIDIKYNQVGIFEGYAYVTKTLETADDVNRYVAGATMTLYDAVEIFYNPAVNYDKDDKWKGVTVERDTGSGNVQMVYVNKGYAGTRIEYVLQKEDESKVSIDDYGTEIDDNYNYQNAINDTGEGVWVAKTIQREDTPILFYSFDNLHVTSNDEYSTSESENKKKIDAVFGSQRYNKEDSVYGFDKEGNVINADQYDNRDFSIYAFEDGETKPVFEFCGGDYANIHYSQNEKLFRFYDEDGNEDKNMRMYHLDEDGNRDSLVDPTTGIAYLVQSVGDRDDSHDNIHSPNDDFNSDKNIKIFVWPVNTFYDGTGNADGNEKGSHYFQKIITTRPATINADTADEYVFGTLKNGTFENSLNPVLDQYGHPVYNRVSADTYVKGKDRYDYDDEEYLGYTYEDGLDAWNENAYVINDHNLLYNTDADDPFNQETHYQYTDKQPIKVTIDIDNNFIVNGYGTVPVPSREGYVFAGWLMDPDQLTDGCTVNAYWRNTNNSMNAEEAKWYSERSAEGTTKTITVTFNANGGAFRAGSGDIHSTDYPLYRRLGDAYIINNTWVTGENTPNDPFDTIKIDTVANTAANRNTISSDGMTANDVYSSGTKAGGQADMLKRLPQSLYIMEELAAPAGYVKGMPVAITMNEMTDIQSAEMTDQTIKVEIVKVDATEDFYKTLRKNGEIQKTAGGEAIKKIEPKGAYSYEHVKGAILSMKGADSTTKKAFSDWVSITSCTDFTKKDSGGTYYIEFDTTKPLFLEGIPAGNYTISEVRTPGGYVTMKPQTITVGEYNGVQIFSMTDEHTKVEIEKYWTDEDGTRKLLSNSDRAKLGLYDSDGLLVGDWYTNDASDYTNGGAVAASVQSNGFFAKAWNSITSLFTNRATEEDYTSFTTRFQTTYNEGHTDITSISWNVKRTAVLKGISTADKEIWQISDGTAITVENGIIPADAPAEFAAAYTDKEADIASFEYTTILKAVKDEGATTSMGDQYWNVDNGTVIHICVSPDDDSSSAGYQSYAVDYQFEYQKLSGKYEGVVTYLTVDGTRRFDYLPKGSYTIRELEVPEGFAIAADKTIRVEETEDIQIFDMENKKRELKIAKYTSDGNGMYFAGYYNDEVHYTNNKANAAVIAGVGLKLYRSTDRIANPEIAFKDGAVPEGAVLVDSWVTGNDGTYTQYEYERELITKDMIGQLKPHSVKDVQDGWYYLVESEGLNYMLTAGPEEFEVTALTTDTELSSMAMVNKAAPLAVRLKKTDINNTPLEGAVFELTNKDTGAVIGTLITDENGNASMNVADTGRFGQDGKLMPYTFILKEKAAPEGYVLNPVAHEFTLTEQNDGYVCSMFNNQDDSLRGGVLYVQNEESQLSISKKDFYTHELVAGTVLEVTKAEFVDGTWQSDGNKKAEWTWTVDEYEEAYGLRGITPDTNYVLHEVSVPAGYTLQPDVFFHTDQNGLGIDKIWLDSNENRYVSFEMDETGAVEAMKTETRTVLGTKAVITDMDTGNSFERGVEQNGRIVLTPAEVTEGHRYNVRTVITMSDLTTQTVDSITFIAEFTDNIVLVWAQYASESRIAITDDAGNTIYQIAADNSTVTILNPESDYEDTLTVSDTSHAGKDHSGVKEGDMITYRVDYQGKNKRIRVYPGAGLTMNSFDPGAVSSGDGSYLFETTAESGSLYIVATVNEEAITDVNLKVAVGDVTLNYMNPVAISGKTGPFAGNDSLVISNAVSGSDPENSTAEFKYKLRLTKEDGSALSGSYDYRTKLYQGELTAYGNQKDFTLTLTGNDYIVINSLPADTKYQITMETQVSDGFRTDKTTAEGTIANNATVNELFSSHRSITAERALLKKNQSYYISEIVKLSDRDYTAASYGFSLDDKCRVTNFILMNRPSTTEITKLNQVTQKALAGAVLMITDADGNVINDEGGNPLTWTSSKSAQSYTGILVPGETYFVNEVSAPDGFAISEPIEFTVSEDGAVDRIVVQDRPTDVIIKKIDSTTGAALAGAVLQIIDKDGNVVSEWTTDQTGTIEIEQKLLAGETYTLREKETVDGYYYSYDITFTVNADGKEQTVEMRNREIKVVTPPDKFPPEPEEGDYPIIWLLKGDASLQGTAEQPIIPGGTYQVLEKTEDGKENVITEITDPDADGSFTMDGTRKEWDVVLKADHTYYLREIKAPDGYALPENDTAFTVTHYGEDIQVPVYNKKTKVTFEKTDFAGEEVAGATCELHELDNGTWKKIDTWTSVSGSSHVLEGTLIAGKEYLFKEASAPAGYAYSAAIRFKVGNDGSVSNARYVNDEKKTVVYGADGRPTKVTYAETLAGDLYQLNGETLTLTNGNLYDSEGNLIVEGAAVTIPVVDNLLVMKDDTISATFKKTDFAGEEIAGAVCTLSEKNPNGTTIRIDRWTTETGNSHGIAGQLKAGTTYIFHEESSAPGYEYSYDIEFTVTEDGLITSAHYLNPDGSHILADKDGYPTGIIVLGDDNYQDGSTKVTIDANGDAVDADGNIHAKGVVSEIPVSNNTVIMKDAPVRITFTKYDEEGNAIEGGSYSIYDEYDEIVKAIKDTQIRSLVHDGFILAGEELTFEAKKEGIPINGILLAGKTYTLRENKAPTGYTINNTGTTFTAPVYNQAGIISVAMTNNKVPARFAKVDENGTKIAGAYLELYVQKEDNTWERIKAWRSTANVEELDGVLETGKNYRYHEGIAPAGYKISPDILFSIDDLGVIRNARYDGDNTPVKVVNNTVEMADRPTVVSFSKTDFAGDELPGADCVLYRRKDDGSLVQIDAWTSENTPHVITGKLAADTAYVFHEEKAPNGYGYSKDITFTLDAAGSVTSAHYIDGNGSPVLYDKDGYQTDITVLEDGSYLYKGQAVTINEFGNAVDAEGKTVAEGVALELTVVGNVIQMKDAPTNVTLKKVDSVSGTALAGAVLQVINKEGGIVAEWTTGADGTFVLEGTLTPGESYTLHEKETIDGYYYSYDVPFTMNMDGKPQTVEMRNRHIKVVTPPDEFPREPEEGDYPTIWLLKNNVEDPSHILQGGTFQVLNEDKTEILIDSFTMNGTWQEWNVVLKADHTYWLHEVTPPAGYTAAEDVKFTVSHYGEDVEAVMTDKPTEVIFKKVDQMTGTSLAGATLAVYKGKKKEPYAEYDPADKVAEWVTDETGIFKLTNKLIAGETYTLREQTTVKGYYYSYDIEFVVNTNGEAQTVEMQNRKIIVETPPDELPKPTPEPEGKKPEYTMEKERTSPAPEKKGTDSFGFFYGDTVYYDVTIKNTGEIQLTMNVDDSFEVERNFSTPEVSAVRFYANETGRQNSRMGQLNSINGSLANITIEPSGYAVVTYKATVLDRADEFLSEHAEDDGLGYLNTATTTDVTGKYYEYSGEDNDGDGKGDEITEVTVTDEDYPEELGDKEDDANTPVQVPDDNETPSYTMEKDRVTEAPEKEALDRYGFNRGDTVRYDVHIKNTGDMALKMYVSDEFAYEIRSYFKDLKIVNIDGEDISEEGMGVGTTTARIRIEPGNEAVVTFTAVVSDEAPERLSFRPEDDGNGYLNTARTYEVKAEKPDGTEGGPDEYPGIPDKEDDGNTPVQTPDTPPEELPPGPHETEYPIIWLLKNSVNDPSHILPGGTFQVLDEDGNAVTDIIDPGEDLFGIGGTWRQWIEVLEADKSYYLHEVTPPEGYLPAEDVKFTVGHYGEKVEAIMTDKRKNDGITFSKQDFAGNEIAGAECALYAISADGSETLIEAWTSSASQHVIKDKLESGMTYRFHEKIAPDGYGYATDLVFTVDSEGNVTTAHYVNADGDTVLYDKNGYPTDIVSYGNGTYSLNGEPVTIDANGNAADKNGAFLAAGVKEAVPVGNNTLILKDEPTKVRILKTDTIGTPLNGGLFEILDSGKRPVKAISNTEIPSTEHDGFIRKGEKLAFAANTAGIDITGQLIVGTEYYLHEVKAPEGYKLADDVMFTIRYAKPGMTMLVRMKDTRTTVAFKKTDFAGEELAGAECILYKKETDGSRTTIDAWTSTTSEHVITGKLTSGTTYIFHEAKAPDGYGYSKDIEFTVDADGNVTEAYYINSAGKPVLYDKDGYQTGITVESDGTYMDGETEITINADGNAIDTDSKVVAEGVRLSIEVIGNIVTMKDSPTTAVIKKVDSETGESLKGVVLQVIDKNGDVVESWTSGDDGVFELVGKLAPGETYTLHEKETIDGYYYSYDVNFTVNMDGKPQIVEMKNRHIRVVTPPDEFPDEPKEGDYPTIWLLKNGIEDPDHILQGGTFQVLSEDKTEILIDSFTMNGTMQEWTKVLKADHSYWLHEVTPPVGYTSAADVKFTVSHYGEDVQAVMTDKKTETEIKKTDSTTGASLAGAKLQILDKDRKVIKEWITDETGTFKITGELVRGETYTLHEAETPDGYYYSYDVQFTVNGTESPQVVEMRNREIKVVTPPDEFPEPLPEPEGTEPNYEMEKERVTLAPEKGDTGEFGFFKGDTVFYDVTVENTGKITLTMDVTDSFEMKDNFSIPEVTSVRFFARKTGQEGDSMGTLNGITGNTANITIHPGGYAVVRYKAIVMDRADEFLSDHTEDDGLGYLNTATTTNVIGKYIEYSGEDKDGDGKGDTETEKTVTKEDYPDELGDKEDDANTPVQEPEGETPKYTMEKERVTEAPEKGETERYGFHRGDVVTYEVHLDNTGDLPLKIYVSDEFDYRISRYFEDLKITDINGEDISEDGMGIGATTARVRIMPGKQAVITYTAKVSENAPEKLSFLPDDDGNGYINIAKAYHVVAERHDGTEGGPDEYPGIPDKEDEGSTPVQNPDETPQYPYIWLLKNRVDDPDHILSGGTFQVLSEDKSEVLIDSFTMNGTWQQWDVVLKADHSYWLHEVTPPSGYLRAEDVKFTVSHYGEDIHVIMTDIPAEDEVTFTKEDFSGNDIPGVSLEVRKKGSDEVYRWISDGTPHTIHGSLQAGETYIYHEIMVPDGYGKSMDIEFTIDEAGVVTTAHYVDGDGDVVLYDADGFQTKIKVKADGTYEFNHEPVKIKDGNAVNENGDIIAYGVKSEIDVTGNVIIMKDAPTEVIFKKVDSETGEPLAGAVLQVLDKNGNCLYEWTTDETGEFRIERGLKAGETYTLHEKGTIDGYYYSYDVDFTVNEDGIPQTVTMRNRHIKVVTPPDEFPGEPEEGDYPTIWLLKNEIGDPDHILQGGTFQVLSEDKSEVLIDSFTMNGTLQEWNVILEADHTYWLHEVTPPVGYMPAEDVKFTVSHYGEDIAVVMTDTPTDVIFKKTDSTTGKALAGATLQVIDKNGTVVKEWVTDETGTFELKNTLIAGETYILREKETVDGYYYSYDITFTVQETAGRQTIEMQNREIRVVTPPVEFPGEPEEGDYPTIWLLKNEIVDPDHILQGGTFQVLSEDKEHILIDNFVMNGTWQQWDIVLQADHSYWLHEVNAPAGYGKSDDVKFTVSHYGEDVNVIMSDKKLPTVIEFTKEDFAGNEIPGAECELKRVEPNGTATIIDKWVSGDEPHVIKDTLSGDTTYRYHEAKAPDGYGYSEDIEFTIDGNGNVKNAHYVDKNGNPILYDKDGFQTTIIVKPDGTYLDGDTVITIDANGNAVDREGKIHAEGVRFEIEVVNNQIRMKDAPTDIVILKRSDDGSALDGGLFTIYKEDGTALRAPYDTNISSTDHDGTIKKGEVIRFKAVSGGLDITGQLNGGESYILHEESAPAGYELASDVKFTVPRSGKEITVVMNDSKKPSTPDKPSGGGGGGSTPQKPSVSVYKYDGNTMIPIEGVSFKVYKDDAELKTVKTDASGYARITSLADGNYRIVEAEAAKGYKAAGQVFTFTVKNETVVGGVTTFHVPNYKETVVTITKRDGDNGIALKDAMLRIVDENSEIVYEGITDQNGEISFHAYKPGHYAVVELEAPEGYDVVDGYITFHVSEEGEVSGTTTMYDFKKERKGKITAKYENGFERGGWYDSDGRWHSLPVTKDETSSNIPYLFAFFGAGLAGIMVLLFTKKKRKKQS